MPEWVYERERYRFNRDVFRARAHQDFAGTFAPADELRQELDEYIATLMHGMSGHMLDGGRRDEYLVYLLVSFARGHMLASDLLVTGDLVDATTIMRRQIEVVARLYEVKDAPDINQLVRQTPNVRHLRENVRKLYGIYSEIAHAANPRDLQLFGEASSAPTTPLYPRFTENAFIALHNLTAIVLHFWSWIDEHATTFGLPYDQEWHGESIKKIGPIYLALDEYLSEAQQP